METEEWHKERMRYAMIAVMILVIVLCGGAFALTPWPYSLFYPVPALFAAYELVRIAQWYYRRRKETGK